MANVRCGVADCGAQLPQLDFDAMTEVLVVGRAREVEGLPHELVQVVGVLLRVERQAGKDAPR
jgi:hypothetical protein